MWINKKLNKSFGFNSSILEKNKSSFLIIFLAEFFFQLFVLFLCRFNLKCWSKLKFGSTWEIFTCLRTASSNFWSLCTPSVLSLKNKFLTLDREIIIRLKAGTKVSKLPTEYYKLFYISNFCEAVDEKNILKNDFWQSK